MILEILHQHWPFHLGQIFNLDPCRSGSSTQNLHQFWRNVPHIRNNSEQHIEIKLVTRFVWMGINESMKKVHLSIWIVNLLKAAKATQSTTVTWICMGMLGYLHADEFIPDNNWSQIITQEFRQLIGTDNVTQWHEKYLTGNLWKKLFLANQKSDFLVGKMSFFWTFTELLPLFPWHRDSLWYGAC